MFFGMIDNGLVSYNSSPEKTKKGVLSMAGGGVKGILHLEILKDLEKRVGDGKKAGDIFHFKGGSSVGSLISCLLDLRDEECPTKRKYSAENLTRIMDPKITQVFSRTFSHDIETLYGIYAPKYSQEGMHEVLHDFFGETKAKDLLGDFCFTSLDTTDSIHAYLPFSSQIIRSNSSWSDLKIVDMLEGTTAAPTYFSSKKLYLDREYNVIDGGTAQNNPAMVTYAEAKRVLQCDDEMVLVSLGTGSHPFQLKETNWGEAEWAPNVLDMIFSGNESVTTYVTDQLLNLPSKERKFYDIQFKLEEGRDQLDDTSEANFAYLKEVAKIYIESDEGDKTLREIAKKLEACV